jgi:2-methylcitrate dehydratase PrpD
LSPERHLRLSPTNNSRAKEYVLDVIGCAIAASKEPQGNILTEVLKEQGGNVLV